MTKEVVIIYTVHYLSYINSSTGCTLHIFYYKGINDRIDLEMIPPDSQNVERNNMHKVNRTKYRKKGGTEGIL